MTSLLSDTSALQPDGPTLPFWVVDVFTDAAFAGNPLAVVGGGEELSTPQCQAVARQFNLSETTFPIRSQQAGADYRLRIFTPATELPFAGHPSVGTAWLLARLGVVAGPRVVQECGAGLIPLDLDGQSDAVRLHSGPLEVSTPIDPSPLLAATGLSADDLAGPPPRLASAGLPFAYLMVEAGTIERLRPNMTQVGELPGDPAGVSVFELASDRAGALQIRARVLAAGVGEDPATGSAALGLAAYLAASGLVAADGESRYEIRQGEQIGRPSRLDCEVTAQAGTAVRASVRGRSVLVSTGRIAVPAEQQMA